MTLAGKPHGFCIEDFFNEIDDCYTDTERAFLCDYFRIKRPAHLLNLDVYAPVSKGFYVKKSDYSEEHEIPNAVARLALARIQDELPVWSSINQQGEFVVARTYTRAEVAMVNFFPQHLFTINWADSGPAVSWPEAYYLVWLPVFERYVITASQDSTDCYGFEDIAIGWQFFSDDRVELAKEVIQANWGSVHKPNCEEGWQCLFATGTVSAEEALLWREEIWPQLTNEEDEDEDES
jgi:hypothetical protein